ncbi:MAG: cupin domain-containing protein [Betaproteobacteria bacterium]|nr:MAG: cupin domain-containing protein [Betaproteobacteria bacterium]
MNDTLAVGAASAIEVFDLKGLQEFAADKRVRKALVKGGQIDVEMACYEPGQSTVMHAHPRQDEIFYVVEGRVNMCIGGTEHAFDAGAMVHVHHGTTHDVRNAGAARSSIIFFKLAIGLLGAIKS